MTLPTSIILPLRKNLSVEKELDAYMSDLIYKLQSMYDQLSRGINGSIRSSYDVQSEQWIPVLMGSTVPGAFTYNHQIGFVFRQGLLIDVWADISWLAIGGATGFLTVELPYETSLSDQQPFIGVCQSHLIPLGVGHTAMTISAATGTFTGEFWGYGSGVATSRVNVAPAGQVIFHLRYLGVQDER